VVFAGHWWKRCKSSDGLEQSPDVVEQLAFLSQMIVSCSFVSSPSTTSEQNPNPKLNRLSHHTKKWHVSLDVHEAGLERVRNLIEDLTQTMPPLPRQG
jgi:hypothetical protein